MYVDGLSIGCCALPHVGPQPLYLKAIFGKCHWLVHRNSRASSINGFAQGNNFPHFQFGKAQYASTIQPYRDKT